MQLLYFDARPGNYHPDDMLITASLGEEYGKQRFDYNAKISDVLWRLYPCSMFIWDIIMKIDKEATPKWVTAARIIK